MVFSSVLIAVPPLNALIHGTHVVTAHAMGAEIGIDTMVLFAGVSWLLMGIYARQGRDSAVLHSGRLRLAARGFNISTVLLVIWLNVSGTVVGYTRYLDLAPPDWLARSNGLVFGGVGMAVALFLALLLGIWLRCLFVAPSVLADSNSVDTS